MQNEDTPASKYFSSAMKLRFYEFLLENKEFIFSSIPQRKPDELNIFFTVTWLDESGRLWKRDIKEMIRR